jgi:Regulator of chromosome condensation (RCC1) repeat
VTGSRHAAYVLIAALWAGCAHAPPVRCRYPEGGRRRAAVPEAIAELAGAVDLAVGAERLCGLMPYGSVRCLGPAARDGSCPDGPVPVGGVVDAAALEGDCARLRDGSARCWGEPRTTEGVELPNAVDEIGLSSGGNGGCARAAGRVSCWSDSRLAPVPKSAPPPEWNRARRVQGLHGARKLVVGAGFACAIAGDQVVCWGANGSGQLGDGTQTDRLEPRGIAGLEGVVEIAAGESSACARTREGRVACWGALPDARGTRAQLTPEWMPLPRARRIALGAGTLCAISDAGAVSCWGDLYTAPLALVAKRVVPAPSGTAPPPVASPGRMQCSEEARYHLGPADAEMVFEGEAECLDWRAFEKAWPNGRCRRLVHRFLRHLRADGREDWTCECVQGRCRSTDTPEPSPGCGEDPESGAPIAPSMVESLCRASPPVDRAAKGRDRYCANGVQEVIGDCPPPGPGHPCVTPRAWVPIWRCFPDARACAENLRTGREAKVAGVDAACTVVAP